MLSRKEVTRRLHESCHCGLLLRNFPFFQQECLHIGDDEARVERTRTVDISDAQQTPQGISKISTCLAMPRSERFSGVAAMPFDCNSFEALLSVTTRLVAKMERDVASPWTRAAIFTVRPK